MELTFFDYLINVTQSFILGYLAIFYLDIKPQHKKGLLIFLFCIIEFTEVTLFNVLQGYEGILLVFYVLNFSLFGFLFSNNNRFECVALGFIALILMSAVNLLALEVSTWITTLLAISDIDSYMIIAKLLATLFMFVFTSIVIRFRNHLNLLNYKMFSMYLLILVVINVIISCVETIYYSGIMNIDLMEFALVLMIVLSMIITKLFFDLQNEYHHFHQNEIMREHLQHLSIQFSEIKEREQRISTLKHDMKNNLHLIHSLIQANEIEKALTLLETKNEEISDVQALMYTGNILIDSVLNHKKQTASQQGIDMKIMFTSLELVDELAFQLSVLLYTSLDNAIENIDLSHPTIQIIIEEKQQMIVLRVINTVQEQILKKNPNLLTQKKDKEHHGYGVPQMKSILKELDGVLHYTQEGYQFECMMIIPLSQQS